jgi:Carboxypeptidase regulatory-like domain
MSRAGVCLVALCLLPVAGGAQPPAPARDTTPRTGTAVIQGRVLVDGSEHALPRTQIRATSDKSQTYDTHTDGDGRYELKQLPAGVYTVSASRPNYVGHVFGQKRQNGAGTRIKVGDGQTIAAVDFKLIHAGVIAGRVVDELGDPITDVQVAPMRSQYVNGTSQLLPSGRAAMTNDLGEFRIFGLAPGRYYVAAVHRGGTMGGNTDDRSGYGPTYYPGTGNVAQAQRITIAAGQTVGGMSFTLLPIRTVRVSGVALDAQGRPLSGAFIMAVTRSFMAAGGGATIRPDGKFTISGLTPGDYMLRVNLPGGGESAMAPVTIADSDVNDIQLIAQKSSTVRGRVLFDGSAAPPGASTLRIFFQPDSPMGVGGNAQVKDDFTFEATMPPGHARVSLFAGDWRLDTVRLDGADVTDSGFDVLPNGATSRVEIGLSARHADVSGTVRDANDTASRDYVVLLFPQDPARWTKPAAAFMARPAADGVFKLRVPGGDYFAVALEELEPGLSNDPDILGQLRDGAQRLSIADGDTRSLVLKFSPPVVY